MKKGIIVNNVGTGPCACPKEKYFHVLEYNMHNHNVSGHIEFF